MNHITITPIDKEGKLRSKCLISTDMIDIIGSHEGKTTISSLKHERSWIIKETVSTIQKRMQDNSKFMVAIQMIRDFKESYDQKLIDLRDQTNLIVKEALTQVIIDKETFPEHERPEALLAEMRENNVNYELDSNH